MAYSDFRDIWDKFGLTMNSSRTKAISNMSNVGIVLKKFDLYKDRISYDEFHNKIFYSTAQGVTEWSDKHTLQLLEYLQKTVHLTDLTERSVLLAVKNYAFQNTKNELTAYLNGLTWDECPRVDRLFSDYFGASENPYTRAISKNFLLSLAARAFNPGCKVDNMVILEGPQGGLKSSSLSVLGGKYYANITDDLGTKDFYLSLQGKFLIEISELNSFKKSNSSSIKGIVSKQVDRFRPPYGSATLDFPRYCVFAGTTNESEYIDDPTGARRFWPIKTNTVKIDELEKDRDQLFAEAVHRFKLGQDWWKVPMSETNLEQEYRQRRDPWFTIIENKLGTENTTTVSKVFELLAVSYENQNKKGEMRISDILKQLGFTRHQESNKARTRYWSREPANSSA